MFKWIKNKFNELTGKDEEIEEVEISEEPEEVEEPEKEVDETEVIEESEEEVEKTEVIEEPEEEVKEPEVIEEPEEEVKEPEVIEGPEEEVKEPEVIEESEEDVEEPEVIEEPKEEVEEPEVVEEPEEELGFFAKLKKGLTKTRDNFTNQIDNILKSYKKIDEELFEDLEEVLIMADVGMETTMNLIDNLRDRVKEEGVTEPNEVMGLLKREIIDMMEEAVDGNELNLEPSPAVILVIGVNGVGKTTTIGKMANTFKQDGKKVLVAAGDTFRAAAIEQLEEWGQRAGVGIISHSEGSDPAVVIFDAVQAAKAREADVLICDTAGRLHNKSNLMQELDKISRVIENEYEDATKEVLLVLDATTGQNAMSQAKQFKEVADITGIALTKLDGTAKGGVVLALQSELNIPVKLVGVGEGINDLQPFNTRDFIDAIFEEED